MKMPALAGVITVRVDQQLARDIERGYTPGQKNVLNLRNESKPVTFEEQQRDSEKATFEEDCEVKKVPLDVHLPDKMVTINATLEPEEEKELLEFLRKNQDVSAWSAGDLRGVSRDIIEHRLDINPNIKPKKQKLRKIAEPTHEHRCIRWLSEEPMPWYFSVEGNRSQVSLQTPDQILSH